MVHVRRMAMAVLAILLFAAPSAHAQDNDAIPGLENLAGLEAGVARAYVFDFSTMGTESTPSESDRFVLAFAGWVFEFDSADNAAAGYDGLVETAGNVAVETLTAQGADVLSEDIADLGNQATSWSGALESQSTTGFMRYLIMQEESYVFLIMIVAESEATAMDTDVLAAHFSSQVGEGHSGLGEMESEGSYTGGLWAFFPASDDPLYAGLVQDEDVIAFPREAA